MYLINSVGDCFGLFYLANTVTDMIYSEVESKVTIQLLSILRRSKLGRTSPAEFLINSHKWSGLENFETRVSTFTANPSLSLVIFQHFILIPSTRL